MIEFKNSTVLQGEILALLHDIGKLHVRFVGKATKNHGWLAPGEDAMDLGALHTLMYLADLKPSAHQYDGGSRKQKEEQQKALL